MFYQYSACSLISIFTKEYVHVDQKLKIECTYANFTTLIYDNLQGPFIYVATARVHVLLPRHPNDPIYVPSTVAKFVLMFKIIDKVKSMIIV